MKNVVNYIAAPTADRFREIDATELAEIIYQLRLLEASGPMSEWAHGIWLVDIDAATRAAELQDAFGVNIFVAEDEDGYYFAYEGELNASKV